MILVNYNNHFVDVYEDIIAHLNNQHEDKDEDEGRIEVGHVEGRAQSTDQRITADNGGQQHRRSLWRQVRHQARKESELLI